MLTYMFLGGLPTKGNKSTYKTWTSYFREDSDSNNNRIVVHPMKYFDSTMEKNKLYHKSVKKLKESLTNFRKDSKTEVSVVSQDNWVNTKWGHWSLIQATLLMLYTAYLNDKKNGKYSNKYILVDTKTIPLYTSKFTRETLSSLEGNFISKNSQWWSVDSDFVTDLFDSIIKPDFSKLVDENGEIISTISSRHDTIINDEIVYNKHNNFLISHVHGFQYKINPDINRELYTYLKTVLIDHEYYDYKNKIRIPRQKYAALDEIFFQDLIHLIKSRKFNRRENVGYIPIRDIVDRIKLIRHANPPSFENYFIYNSWMRKNIHPFPTYKQMESVYIVSKVISWGDYLKNIRLNQLKEFKEFNCMGTTFVDWEHFQINYNNLFRFRNAKNDVEEKELIRIKAITSHIMYIIINKLPYTPSKIEGCEEMSEVELLYYWLTHIPDYLIPPFFHPLEYIDNSIESGCKFIYTDPISGDIITTKYTEKQCSSAVCYILEKIKVYYPDVGTIYNEMVRTIYKKMVSEKRKRSIGLIMVRVICAMLYYCPASPSIENSPSFDINPVTMEAAKKYGFFFIRKVDSKSDHIYNMWKLSSSNTTNFKEKINSVMKLYHEAESHDHSLYLAEPFKVGI